MSNDLALIMLLYQDKSDQLIIDKILTFNFFAWYVAAVATQGVERGDRRFLTTQTPTRNNNRYWHIGVKESYLLLGEVSDTTIQY